MNEMTQKLRNWKIVFLILVSYFIVQTSFSQHEVSNEKNTVFSSDSCCKSIYSKTQMTELSLTQLGSEFRRIKQNRCKLCNAFGSDLMSIMSELKNDLYGCSKKTMYKTLGKPDEIVNGKYMYYWRGRHDYLYFEFKNNKATSHWYYAYE
jgi:hypothetical protein